MKDRKTRSDKVDDFIGYLIVFIMGVAIGGIAVIVQNPCILGR